MVKKKTSDYDSALEKVTRSSSLIFSGTVVQRGTSTVPSLQPSENLVVVRVDRGLRVDPVLGDLQGKILTMAALAPESLLPDQKAIFFTNSWIHGRGIAVRELKHLEIREEDAVAAVIEQLPQLHLLERLQNAELVVNADVVRISPFEKRSGERKVALWAAAELHVKKVLRGQARESTVVYFPTAEWPPWTNAPRFKEQQRGVFILHAPRRDATLSEATLEDGCLVALDPADFQAISQLQDIENLLASIESKRRVL
jgi:hypothetical protein